MCMTFFQNLCICWIHFLLIHDADVWDHSIPSLCCAAHFFLTLSSLEWLRYYNNWLLFDMITSCLGRHISWRDHLQPQQHWAMDSGAMKLSEFSFCADLIAWGELLRHYEPSALSSSALCLWLSCCGASMLQFCENTAHPWSWNI